jgi:hypothetical protein
MSLRLWVRWADGRAVARSTFRQLPHCRVAQDQHTYPDQRKIVHNPAQLYWVSSLYHPARQLPPFSFSILRKYRWDPTANASSASSGCGFSFTTARITRRSTSPPRWSATSWASSVRPGNDSPSSEKTGDSSCVCQIRTLTYFFPSDSLGIGDEGYIIYRSIVCSLSHTLQASSSLARALFSPSAELCTIPKVNKWRAFAHRRKFSCLPMHRTS